MVEPTEVKKEILDRELKEWHSLLQDYKQMQIHDFPICSTESEHKWLKNSDRHASYVTQVVKKDLDTNEQLNLRNDCFKVEKRNTELVPFWANIPTKQRYGGVWLPLEVPYRYYDVLEEWNIKDSKLTKENGEYWVHINVEKEFECFEPKGILALDLGSRWLGVGVCGNDNKPLFVGKKIRTIRGKYQYLRKRMQKKGIDGFAKDKEERKVDYYLHTSTKWIARFAEKNQLAVVVGNVSANGDMGKGRKFNRLANSMPTGKFKQYLKYKCKERGVPFEEVDEAYTTQDCSCCGSREGRPNGKQFTCSNCGLSVHADRNGAMNIKKRGQDKLNLEPMSCSGATLAWLETPEVDIKYAHNWAGDS